MIARTIQAIAQDDIHQRIRCRFLPRVVVTARPIPRVCGPAEEPDPLAFSAISGLAPVLLKGIDLRGADGRRVIRELIPDGEYASVAAWVARLKEHADVDGVRQTQRSADAARGGADEGADDLLGR